MGMTPTRRGNNRSTILISVLTGFIVLALVAVLVAYFSPSFTFGEKKEETPSAKEADNAIISVPEDKRTPLKNQIERGSMLRFGNKEKGTNVVLFADPEDLSRQKALVNGKPSKFLTEVQKGNYYLTYFPVPKTPERSQFVQNVSKVAKCRQATDLSTTSIFTLNAIVKAGEKLPSDASVDDIAKLMNADMALCPEGIDEGVQQLAGNTRYFMYDAFGLNEEKVTTALYANNSIVTDIFNLKEGWEKAIANGVEAGLMAPRGEGVVELNTIHLVTNNPQ